MNKKIMTEQELITQLKAGSEDAFSFLVAEYQEMLGNVCLGFVQNQADAEELVQDVFVEVFFSIKKFKSESKLATWLYRIAVNKSLNFIAKRNRKRRVQSISTFFGFGEKDKDYGDFKSPDPSRKLENVDTKKAVESALNKLSEQQRTAYLLRKYEDMPYKKIATVMKTSVASVESLIHRANNNMKRNLKEYFEREYLE